MGRRKAHRRHIKKDQHNWGIGKRDAFYVTRVEQGSRIVLRVDDDIPVEFEDTLASLAKVVEGVFFASVLEDAASFYLGVEDYSNGRCFPDVSRFGTGHYAERPIRTERNAPHLDIEELHPRSLVGGQGSPRQFVRFTGSISGAFGFLKSAAQKNYAENAGAGGDNGEGGHDPLSQPITKVQELVRADSRVLHCAIMIYLVGRVAAYLIICLVTAVEPYQRNKDKRPNKEP